MRRIVLLFILMYGFSNAQIINQDALTNLPEFFNDAVYFSDRYVTPATDVAVYQAASGWLYTAKKPKLWETTLGVHGNVFLVPSNDKNFVLNDSDFKFLKIQNGTSATVESALGNGNQTAIIDKYGLINTSKPILTPKGVDQSSIIYPHLSGSIGLPLGFSLVGKYAPKTRIEKGEYQVYGIGLSCNVSHYMKELEKDGFYLSFLASSSKEIISFDFLDVKINDPLSTTSGKIYTLGINRITGDVKSLQFQVSGSKTWRNFEFMLTSITNKSDFKYYFSGEKGTIDNLIQFEGGSSQAFFNKKLEGIYKTKFNSIIEVSATYNYRKFYFQSAFAFNKFLNTNISVHYKIN